MDAKSGAQEKFKTIQQDVLALSHRIHAHPELGFEEEKACGWLADALDGAGFQVQRGVTGLETAFIAKAGHGPLHIGICAEYDSPARDRPRLRTQHDCRDGRRRGHCRREGRRRRWVDHQRLRHSRRRSGQRQRQNSDARTQCVRRRACGDDGSSRAFRNDQDAPDRRLDVRRSLHRQGSARLRVSRTRHQRRRRAHRRADRPSACCASTFARPTAFTESPRTAETRPTWCPRTLRRVTWCARKIWLS